MSLLNNKKSKIQLSKTEKKPLNLKCLILTNRSEIRFSKKYLKNKI